MVNVSKGKKYIPVFLDKSIHQEILVYAAETGQTIQDVVQPLSDEFVQSALKLIAQIKALRREAYERSLKEEEYQKISLENPIQVSGHPEDPIGTVSIEQTT